MLSAICVALRLVLVDFPNVKPVTAIFLAIAVLWSLGDSLLVMLVTMLVSAIWLGMSVIVVAQIGVYALLITIFWALARMWAVHWQALFAFLLCFVYGFGLDVFSGLIYGFGKAGLVAYWLAGLPFDLAHALSTAVCLPVVTLILREIEKRAR
jgi:hypothetical protein